MNACELYDGYREDDNMSNVNELREAVMAELGIECWDEAIGMLMDNSSATSEFRALWEEVKDIRNTTLVPGDILNCKIIQAVDRIESIGRYIDALKGGCCGYHAKVKDIKFVARDKTATIVPVLRLILYRVYAGKQAAEDWEAWITRNAGDGAELDFDAEQGWDFPDCPV